MRSLTTPTPSIFIAMPRPQRSTRTTAPPIPQHRGEIGRRRRLRRAAVHSPHCPGRAGQAGRQRPHHRRRDRRRRPGFAAAGAIARRGPDRRACDCNLPRAEAFKAKKKGDWPVYQDYRKLLERKDIDAVIVATGEFQRVLPCIHACQAGKDVYAEKPLTLYIREGRVLVDAVRRHDRVFQVGTQQRSMAMNRIACELVRSGGLGKVLEVRAINYSGSEASPPEGLPEEPVPAGLNWDVWLNQAAMRPFNADWMGWMRWRDFAGGEMTNWGAHGVDQIQWALGMDGTGPVEMWPLTPGPNGQVAMRYANGVEVRFVLEPGKGPMGGAIFVCEKGKLEINRNKFTSNPKEIAAELLKKVDVAEEERKWSDEMALWQARWHMQNWLDCDPHPQAPGGRRRDRPSLDQRLPPGEHHPRRRPPTALGSEARAIHRR